MSRPSHCAAALTIALLGLVSLAEARIDLVEMPRPDLTEVDAAVSSQLSQARTDLDRLQSNPATSLGDLAEALGSVGQLYLLHELDDAATACFINAVRTAPKDPRWAYYLAVIRQRSRQLDDAADLLDRVLDLDPGNVAARVRAAQVALEDGDLERAAKDFRSLLDHPEATAAAEYGLGRIAAERGDSEAAIEHFRSVLASQPQASAAHYQMGLALRQLGRLDEAREHLSQYGRVPVQFADPLMETLSEKGAGAGFHIVRAAAARSAGDLELAAEEYRAAIALDPDRLAARQALATTLFEIGDEQGGIEELREVLERDPENASAHYNLGTILSRQSKFGEALTHLEASVGLAPDFADAWANLGLVLERLERFDQAVESYSQAVRLDPGDMRLRLQRAAALSRAGRSQAAISDMEAVLERNPDNTQALFGLAMTLAANAETDKAIATLRRILELESTPGVLASVHYNLGAVLADAGRSEEAMIQLRRSLNLNPDLLAARARLANVLADNSRFEEAAREFAELARRQPDNPQARFGEAVSLLLAEHYDQALAQLEESTARFPESLAFRNALARLLAACPDPDVRDGERALVLSRELVAARPDLEYHETLAMALAELGRFEEAGRLQARLIEQARSTGLADVLPALEDRLELYRAGRPCRAPWSTDRH